MGRLIDADELLDWIQNCWDWATVDGITSTTVLKQTMIDISQLPTVEAIPKDQYEQRLKENNELINDLEELRTMINKFAESYENRLKADMVAMLEDLDLQIDESAAYNLEVAKVQRLIRDRINALRGDNE